LGDKKETIRSRSGEDIAITLDDVELAIKILEIFINRVEKARRVLRKVNRLTNGYRFTKMNLIEWAMAQQFQSRSIESNEKLEYGEEELSDEERKRIEALKRKFLNK